MMTEEILNKDSFYSMLWHTDQASFFFEKCLGSQHLEPLNEFLLEGRHLSPFSEELTIYSQASRCVLDFEIYTLEQVYRMGNLNAVELMMDCYHRASKKGVNEAYNNIGVFLAMTDRCMEALPYWKKAAQGGSSCGWINLLGYFGTQNDYNDMLLCLKKLIRLNHPLGFWNMAVANHFGYLNLSPQLEKAKRIYAKMMKLTPIEEDENDIDSLLLQAKTMACYNLAKIRFLTEDHNNDNLATILELLTSTPYVLQDRPRENALIEEIRDSIKR